MSGVHSLAHFAIVSHVCLPYAVVLMLINTTTSANTPLALTVVIARCLRWWCFPRSTSALLMCILQLALCVVVVLVV